jgi:hypothetical protein
MHETREDDMRRFRLILAALLATTVSMVAAGPALAEQTCFPGGACVPF